MRSLLRSSLVYALLGVITLFVTSCAKDNQVATDDGGDNGGGNGGGSGTVVVASMSATAGQQGVVIPVWMTNDFPLRGIVMPLALRSVDQGAFITSLKLSFSDRLPIGGLLSDIKFTNQLFQEDGTCKGGKQGGFGTIESNDTLPHAIAASPVGVLFIRQRLVADNLPSGADNSGSFLMTVDVTTTAGKFTIDTTCVNPSNHLLLIKPDVTAIIPSFTRGTITIQ